MQVFRAKDVERVLGMRRSALRMLVQRGLVVPRRGPGRQYQFSFQDLAKLRAAQRRTDSGQYLLELDFTPPPPNDALDGASVLQILESHTAPAAGYEVEEHQPDDIARLDWGQQLHEEGLVEAAEAIYRGGLKHGNGPPDLLLGLGELLELTGRELEAIDFYKKALAQTPDDPDVHFLLARVYQQLGMSQAAARHWTRFRELSPTV